MGPLKKSHHGAKIIAKLKGTLGFEDRHRHDGSQDADTDERQTASFGASVAGKIDLDDRINTSDSTLNNWDEDGDVPASRTDRLETFETTCNRTPGQPAQIPGTDNKDSEMAKDEISEHKITKVDHAGAADNSPPEFTHNILWDEAYQHLKRDNQGMLDAYEKILSRVFLKSSPEQTQGSDPDNIIAQDAPSRDEQMKIVVEKGLERIQQAKKVTEGYGKFFQLVTPFKNVLDTGLQNVPQAALPWGVVSASLDILARPAKVGTVLYTGVNEVVSRMDWYSALTGKLLKSDDINGNRPLETSKLELKNRILDLYKALLLYQIKSVCYYYRNQFQVFLRGFVELDDWSGDLKTVTDAENALRNDLNQYNQEHIKLLLESTLVIAKDQCDFREEMEREKEERKWLSDLYWIDPRDEVEAIKARKDDLVGASYQWVLATSEYKRFTDREASGSNLLWIKGQAGTGKTMLLIGIIHELMNQCLSDPNSPQVAYFFFQGTADQLNNGVGALRSLIWMLVLQQPRLRSHLRKTYEASGFKAFENYDAFEKLSRILKEMLTDKELEPVFLVVDAIDECDEKSVKGTRTSVIRLFKTLLSSLMSNSKVKWLVSCRPLPEIESEMEGTSLLNRSVLDLDQESLEKPINYYIDYKVHQLREKSHEESLLTNVAGTLRQRAGNTFMWVALVCRELMVSRARVWPEILETVPEDLMQLYHYLFQRIESMKWEGDVKDCIRVLAAATVAPQPLTLSGIGQLADLPSTEEARLVVKLCGSFVMIRNDHVYLIHQSAQDYLRSRYKKMEAIVQNLGHAAIRRLGNEQKYKEVEYLLSALWMSRELQRSWKQSIVLVVGHRLIMARYYIGQPFPALKLAEDIYYNVCRFCGDRDSISLAFGLLVSQLYNALGQHDQSNSQTYYLGAANVNANILEAFVEADSGSDEDENIELGDQTPPQDIASPLDQKFSTVEYIHRHLYLFKLALRRHGKPLPPFSNQYRRLSDYFIKMFPKELEGIVTLDEWDLNIHGASEYEGTDYLPPSSLDDWGLTASK